GTTGYPYRLERYLGGNIEAFKCSLAQDDANPGAAGKYIGIDDDREITYTIICNGQIIFSTAASRKMDNSFYLHAARIPQGTDKAIFLEASNVFVKNATDYNYSITMEAELEPDPEADSNPEKSNCRFGARHNNEGSVAFLDGHAEMLSSDLLSDSKEREEWTKHHIEWWNDTSYNNPPW
ncbi:MAG: hypothetical protein MJ025_06625, partial [Victivallaceae bacterium]|nr:hypothetical protein [Victivallaceae bacterium]